MQENWACKFEGHENSPDSNRALKRSRLGLSVKNISGCYGQTGHGCSHSARGPALEPSQLMASIIVGNNYRLLGTNRTHDF